jgi:hypothetical protein
LIDYSNGGAEPPGQSGRVRRLVNHAKRKFQERRALRTNETATDRAARRTAKATVVIAIFSIASAGSAVATLWILRGQLHEMKKAYGPLQTSADAAKASAGAAFEQATQNRARIWIEGGDWPKPDLPIPNPPGPYVSLNMSFTIVNYGPTPAIITGAMFHLFWTPEEPDPLNPAADALHEFAVWPPDTGAEINSSLLDSGPLRSIPGNTSKIIHKKFNFMPEADYVTMRVKRAWYWFYARINYKDIYDVDRETSFYGRAPISLMEISEKYPKYNYHR